MSKNQRWVPLLEYAVETGLSLSTLRRYIKSGKIGFKIERGRYLIEQKETTSVFSTDAPPTLSPDLVQRLQSDLKRARDEIVELKTLIALYEDADRT